MQPLNLPQSQNPEIQQLVQAVKQNAAAALAALVILESLPETAKASKSKITMLLQHVSFNSPADVMGETRNIIDQVIRAAAG